MPRAWRWLDERLSVGWLARCFAAMADDAAGRIPQVRARAEALAERLIQAASEPGWDEVLLVGHSSGTLQAVRTLGRALELDPQLGEHGPRVSLLTLGDSIPGYTALPDDPRFKAYLSAIAADTRITWLDVTSPGDPAAGGLLHPLKDLMASPPQDRPVRRSPRFHKVLSAETFRRVRANALSFHFQYLKATEKPGGYDFFRIVCGPQDLETFVRRPAEAVAE
jgi:pimeloyl-ACP methyl ester carboxylesterase